MSLGVAVWIVVPLIVCVSICGVLAHIALVETLAAVNQKLPPEEKFKDLFWGYLKIQRLRSEYRRLYPDGGLLRKITLLSWLGGSSLVVAWTLLCTAR